MRKCKWLVNWWKIAQTENENENRNKPWIKQHGIGLESLKIPLFENNVEH